MMHARELRFLAILGASLLCRTGMAGDAPHQWGTIKGQVVWGGGELPPKKNAQVNQDQEHCLSKGPIPDESWVIRAPTREFAGRSCGCARTASAKAFNQPGAQNNQTTRSRHRSALLPIRAARVGRPRGARADLQNSAPVAHNVNWTGVLKNPGSNQILPAGRSFAVKGLVADKYPLTVACNIHPWMKAWVRVFDNPYYAVTDADGNFEIKLSPTGKCRLFIWQESVGYRGVRRGP